MADHVSKQLRLAVKARLMGLDTTGPRVFGSRVYPLQQTELPGICVYVPREEAEATTIHAPTYQRSPDIAVACYAVANADMEDALDQIRLEVETALGTPIDIGGRATYVFYTGFDSELNAEGEKPHGVATLLYRATLFTNAAAPDVLL